MARSGDEPLAAWLRAELGVQMVARTPVGGGCIHQAWCLNTSCDGQLFVKTNRAESLPWLVAEAEGLEALAAVAPAGLVIPRPLALGLAGQEAVLVLPWLELGGGGASAGAWAACGAHLAQLHRRSLEPGRGTAACTYGWSRDNFIGASPQPNDWRSPWSRFFAECRLQPQFRLLTRKGCPLEGAERLLDRLPGWLDQHSVDPCLVHGDLWSGNAALLVGGGASLFDPAVYRGDREVDLAMARLFGGFPAAFFQGYQEEWPLAEGWRERTGLYNLYHLLNHLNLFGGGYRDQAQNCINSLIGSMA